MEILIEETASCLVLIPGQTLLVYFEGEKFRRGKELEWNQMRRFGVKKWARGFSLAHFIYVQPASTILLGKVSIKGANQ